MKSNRRSRKLGVALAVLTGSYLAKRRLCQQWDKSDRTGENDLTLKSATYLVALAIPWDLTFGLFSRRNILFGSLRGKRRKA